MAPTSRPSRVVALGAPKYERKQFVCAVHEVDAAQSRRSPITEIVIGFVSRQH